MQVDDERSVCWWVGGEAESGRWVGGSVVGRSVVSGFNKTEVLNKSFEDNIEIEKGQQIGFFVVESENLKFQHVPCKKLHAEKQRGRQEAF